MQTGTLPNPTTPERALVALQRARDLEPDPLHATRAQVASYVTRLQHADRALALALEAAGSTLPAAETALLLRRRHLIDVAIARQAGMAARRLGSDRHASLATLNAIFDLGTAPHPPMSGDYRGELLTSTLFGPFDTCARFLSRFWLPWKGKHFDPATSTGYNYLTPGGHGASRLTWPLYKHAAPALNGLYRYFNFNTSTGPAVGAHSVTALKLDYNLPENPIFLVRSVLDELVQISGGYYLGKAYLRSRNRHYRLAAFFALHAEDLF